MNEPVRVRVTWLPEDRQWAIRAWDGRGNMVGSECTLRWELGRGDAVEVASMALTNYPNAPLVTIEAEGQVEVLRDLSRGYRHRLDELAQVYVASEQERVEALLRSGEALQQANPPRIGQRRA
jgi:hypothetical protein